MKRQGEGKIGKGISGLYGCVPVKLFPAKKYADERGPCKNKNTMIGTVKKNKFNRDSMIIFLIHPAYPVQPSPRGREATLGQRLLNY